jgi:hypothetical protein
MTQFGFFLGGFLIGCCVVLIMACFLFETKINQIQSGRPIEISDSFYSCTRINLSMEHR